MAARSTAAIPKVHGTKHGRVRTALVNDTWDIADTVTWLPKRLTDSERDPFTPTWRQIWKETHDKIVGSDVGGLVVIVPVQGSPHE